MKKIGRVFLCVSTLAVASSAIPVAKAQSLDERFRQQQEGDARRAKEFNKMWNPREADTKVRRGARRRTLQEWQRQRGAQAPR
jgi:hypothetical protein